MNAWLLFPLLLILLLATVASAADLPVTGVALFTSGVGYFERVGQVQGDTTVDLTFRTEQINDILKSLVLQDLGGGTIAPVTYASQEPLSRTLSSFAINIGDNPSLRDLWDRLRGAQVRLTVGETVVEGTAFGSEVIETVTDDTAYEVQILNLLTHKGLMQFPLSTVTSIKLLDQKLDADLQKALAAIDKARDTDRKPVTLAFNGQGNRTVAVGYLLETPVWKTTYRLVKDKDSLLLQGWALVENTTDDDWNKVSLSLVSGRPVSFTQNLYQPLYLSRPDVPVQVASAARPRFFEGAMDRPEEADNVLMYERKTEPTRPSAVRAMAMPAPAAPAPASTGAPGMFGAAGGAGAAAMAEGAKVGTLFQYAISQPVTIPRQRSAMIPIINQKVEGEAISVYSQSSDPRHPMNGIRLKNTSGLHLMGGPITVFDGNTYGGDALIEDVPPGDERLLTYAMDLAVEVEPQAKAHPEQLIAAKITKGVLHINSKSRMETKYNVRNNATEKRTVLIEHPLRPGWTLVEPKEAPERTRNVYRFSVPVAAGQTASITVIEEQPRWQEVVLVSRKTDDIALYLRSTELSPKVKEALQQIVKMQDELAALTQQRADKETRIKEIEQEQERIRNNMKELERDSELYKQYVAKLTAQEAEFEKLRQETAALRAQEIAKRQQIADFVAGLNIE